MKLFARVAHGRYSLALYTLLLPIALIISLFGQMIIAPVARGATCGASTNFITTWKTDNPGTSNSTSIIVSGTGAGYNYSVDWNNDGIMDQTGITSNSITHDFGASGTYTIQICGSFPRIYLNTGGDNDKLVSVNQWGDNQWTSMSNAFSNIDDLVIDATDVPDLSVATDLSYMFYGARNFVGNSSMNAWDTGNITNMSNMFLSAFSFNSPIGNWDTSNVTDMSGMFSSASAFNQPIGNWNTSSVTDMSTMFSAARVFNQPIGNWDTSSVINMSHMFYSAFVFNQPIGNWDTSIVANMSSMFSTDNDSSEYPIFNQPLNNWNTSSVTNMSEMFQFAKQFNGSIGTWDTSDVLDMSSMFEEAEAFNQPIGNWDTSSVTDMSYMFWKASSFNQPIGAWDVSSVTDMQLMFSGVYYEVADPGTPSFNFVAVPMAFNQDISGWDTGNVTNMWGMFSSDSAAVFAPYIDMGLVVAHVDDPIANPFSYSLASWDVSQVTEMHGMLSSTSLSPAEYDSTLAGWSALTLENGLTLGADGLSYCASGADRTDIINTYSWTINDDGASCLDLTPGRGLSVVDIATSSSLLNPDATQRTLRLFKNGLPLGETTILFNTVVDWTSVDGDIDATHYKSVVAGLAGADSIVNGHTLYVPRAASHGAVIICPDALTLSQVSVSCSNAQVLTVAASNVSTVAIDGKMYWKVDGLTGTGGMSVPSAPNTGYFKPTSLLQVALVLVGIALILVGMRKLYKSN